MRSSRAGWTLARQFVRRGLPALALVVLPFLATLAGAQPGDGPPMADTVQALEIKVGVPAEANRSLLERVSALEVSVFGQSRQGSLLTRIQALNQAVDGGPAGKQSPPAQPAPPSPPEGKSESQPAVKSNQSQAALSGAVQISAYKFSQSVPLANLSPPRFFRIEPPNPAQKMTGDYYSDVMKATKGKIFRFKSMPIPVYITPYQERGFTEACIRGFELWEEKTHQAIRFIQVEDPQQARIRVIWTPLGMSSDEKGCTLGAHTMLKWKSRPSGSMAVVPLGVVPVPIYIPKVGPKYSVPPQIIEVNLTLILNKPPEQRYQLLENVVAHELGHALGLLGHSPAKTDMMFPLTDEHSRLSPRDVNTVLKVYEQKVDIPL